MRLISYTFATLVYCYIVSNGNILCDLIRVCALMTRMNTHKLETRMNFIELHDLRHTSVTRGRDERDREKKGGGGGEVSERESTKSWFELLTLGVCSTCRKVTVVCLVNCVLCIVISRTASPGTKVTTKMNSTGYLYQDRPTQDL